MGELWISRLVINWWRRFTSNTGSWYCVDNSADSGLKKVTNLRRVQNPDFEEEIEKPRKGSLITQTFYWYSYCFEP
jgi:hypothetical protein